MTTVENTYLTGNFAPVLQEVTAVDLPVTGTIPDGLEGRLLRNGPNPMAEEDPASYHWFVGTGMVHGVRIRDGKAEWYRNRSVGSVGGVANTNVIGHAGTTLAIVEAGLPPVELTYELEPLGTYDFGGTLDGAFTAHAKKDPATGELHAVTYYWEWEHMRYLVVGVDGRIRRSVDIPVPGRVAVHDTAVTESKVVLFDLPLVFNLDAAMSGARFPYLWDPSYVPRIGLLPREGSAEAVQWFEIEPCFVYHPLNAYDQPDGSVVLDAVRHPSTFAKDVLGPNDGATTLDRWTLDPASGKAREERLDDHSQEFPRHDERLLGRRHRFGYGATFKPGIEFGGAIKHDLVAGTSEIHDFGPGRSSLEPVFVPRTDDAAEDDGWVMAYVHDATTDRSDVVILAAQDFTGDPVATIALPQRVPFGFHGNWVPD